MMWREFIGVQICAKDIGSDVGVKNFAVLNVAREFLTAVDEQLRCFSIKDRGDVIKPA